MTRAPGSDATPGAEAEPVRWFVNPYPWRDWAVVVRRTLRQRPDHRHRGDVSFVPADVVLDESVQPATTVAFLGDVMPVRRRRLVLDPALADFLAASDHLVVNLEGVLWPGPAPAPKVFALQRHHDLQVLDALSASVGRNRMVVSLANNHAADLGRDAHHHTAAVVADEGYVVVGTTQQPRVRLGEVNLAAVTEWTNQAHRYLPRLADEAALLDPDADFQLLVPHWGIEMETTPRPAVVERAARLAQRWDAIVGHHPHVPNPVATVDGPGGERRVVAFSLGQAASDLRYPLYRYGIALRLALGPRPDGRWAVGSLSWRFLALEQPDDATVRVAVRATNRWFPEVAPA